MKQMKQLDYWDYKLVIEILHSGLFKLKHELNVMSSLELDSLSEFNRTLRDIKTIDNLISEYEKLKGPYNPLI